jgi:hypothetical protein
VTRIGARRVFFLVVAGLDPVIHAALRHGKSFVGLCERRFAMDTRVKPAHDGG